MPAHTPVTSLSGKTRLQRACAGADVAPTTPQRLLPAPQMNDSSMKPWPFRLPSQKGMRLPQRETLVAHNSPVAPKLTHSAPPVQVVVGAAEQSVSGSWMVKKE